MNANGTRADPPMNASYMDLNPFIGDFDGWRYCSTWPSYVCRTQIPCEFGPSPGDLSALSKAGLTSFETGPV